MISLDSFISIANGTHNVGQIRISRDGRQLEKVNNHVYKTSQNNVQLTADENRAVRTALLNALSGRFGAEYVETLREQLVGGANATRSLSRDYVKALIHGAETHRDAAELATVQKTLAQRTFGVVTPGVTSTKEAAYDKGISEQMDKDFEKPQTVLAGLRTWPENKVERMTKFVDAMAITVIGLKGAAHDDPRLTADQRNQFRDALDAQLRQWQRVHSDDLATMRVEDALTSVRHTLVKLFDETCHLPEAVSRDYCRRLFPDVAYHGIAGVKAEKALAEFHTRKDSESGAEWLTKTIGARTEALIQMRNAVVDDESIPFPLRQTFAQRFRTLLETKNGARAQAFLDVIRTTPEDRLVGAMRAFIHNDLVEVFADVPGQEFDFIETRNRYLNDFGL